MFLWFIISQTGGIIFAGLCGAPVFLRGGSPTRWSKIALIRKILLEAPGMYSLLWCENQLKFEKNKIKINKSYHIIWNIKAKLGEISIFLLLYRQTTPCRSFFIAVKSIILLKPHGYNNAHLIICYFLNFLWVGVGTWRSEALADDGVSHDNSRRDCAGMALLH